MGIAFEHNQTAHCENGVTTNLLQFNGVDFITEPLAFGLGAGLLYFHIPFITVSGGPAVTFRTSPGSIFKRTCKALQIPVESKRFKKPKEAQIYLDKVLNQGIPVGAQVGVFHLPYFAKEYRFHFNAHNMVIFDKKDSMYQVSDPVMETITEISEEDLETVRFAKGIYAPKGHLYFPKNTEKASKELLKKGIYKGIQKNIQLMLQAPGPWIGVSGMNYTAKKIRQWRDQHGPRKAGLYLGQIVRMQEEIGTGGGGFRYIYGAFLEQASEINGNDKLAIASDKFTEIGDLWRNSAIEMAGIYKGKNTEQKDFNRSAGLLEDLSKMEKEAFEYLKQINKP